MNMSKYMEHPAAFALIVFASVLFLTPCVHAEDDFIARYGAEFMAGGGGARAQAMGGAQTAVAGDVWSFFWNPANVGSVKINQAGFTHSERFDGAVDYDVAIAAFPQKDGSTLSLGMIRLGVNGVEFTEKEITGDPLSDLNRVVVDKVVNEAEYAFYFGRTFSLKNWHIGVSPKLIFKHFGWEHRAYGLGLDAGIVGRPIEKLPLTAGLSVQDVLGTPIAWETTGRKEIIVSTLRAGLAAEITIAALDAVVRPVGDVSYRLESAGESEALAFNVGLEYLVSQAVALRIGDDEGKFTFGGGISLKPLDVDYAFYEHDDLGATHRVSITVRWGGEIR